MTKRIKDGRLSLKSIAGEMKCHVLTGEEFQGSQEEKEKLKNKTLITFDLQSDMILPFNDIYDAQKQFKILANLSKEFEFNYDRSFINIEKLEGYNIINGIRKVDELIFSRGSVFTFEVENYESELMFLKKIEEKGLGLRKNEGFGRVKICSLRGNKE